MSKTPKFFTKKWYPWNIIILVLSILLIAILIWGGVTNWKFIPKELGDDCASRGPCPRGMISTGNTNPPCCKLTPPTPPKPPTPTPTPTPTPKPPTPTPTPPTPLQKCSYKLDVKVAKVPNLNNTYGYLSKKDYGGGAFGSLNPDCFFDQITNANIPVASILFTKGMRVRKYPNNPGPFLNINFPIIDPKATPTTSAFYQNCVNNKGSCNIKINVKYGKEDRFGADYIFNPLDGGTDDFTYWWVWPDKTELSELLNATITIDLIQIPEQ